MKMEIEEVCRRARAAGLSYGQYVFKYLPHNAAPPVRKKSKFPKLIRQYGMDGRLVAEYDSVDDAALAVGTSAKNLLAALRGDNQSSMGYQWRYTDDLTAVKKNAPIYQYTPSGELVGVYQTLADAERASGCRNVSRAIAKNYKAGGFYWRRK